MNQKQGLRMTQQQRGGELPDPQDHYFLSRAQVNHTTYLE